jgi:16S rRNA processing protein RimM
MEKHLRVGVISSTHGVRGEVKVFPTTDDPNRFKELKEVLLDTGKDLMPLEIEGVKFFKQMVILKFKGIDNINDIEKYRGKDLLVTRENAVKLEKDEYFIFDLIDSEVYTEEGEKLGRLAEILSTAANDVYIVKTEQGKEILIPSIKECILDVDVENKKITVHLLEGLR